jgi:hypothetical protein
MTDEIVPPSALVLAGLETLGAIVRARANALGFKRACVGTYQIEIIQGEVKRAALDFVIIGAYLTSRAH